MPANLDEVYRIKNIVDTEVGNETAYHIFLELWEKVGIKSDNLSLKLTFNMLEASYHSVPSELQKIYDSYINPQEQEQADGYYDDDLTIKRRAT